ncbi:hypothetical protein LSTR_LSTR000027 [Laodelphax striatellus]|uniref:EF-hand domain-containing protein n=1 Tax=Laodelphax striatellus TaxID=195883 RepID=A0A482X6H8_LAOST|nr:hypothetical protein LSTR_LSTR000027 [Laodelphax striatellus]
MTDTIPKTMVIGAIQTNGLALASSEATTASPEASSTASDSPTPTNSVGGHERNWSSHWQGLVCEEHRQLLGTEEESSDRHSSDGEADVDDAEVWTMNEEQLEYYRKQFCSLQPDPNSLLPGQVARKFFEKSRLPVQELSKIWQLSDVTKDGALSLAEFNTAMHLVVLRRNNIPLPDTLPAALMPAPAAPAQDDVSSPLAAPPPPVPPPQPPSPTPSNTESASSPHRGKEWTKFFDSPTSSVSSPGPKPVNFDFHKSAVEQDPKILHPVPLRVTPGPDSLEEEPKRLTEQLSGGGDASPIRPIQRPQPKKTPAPGPGAIPPPPQSLVEESVGGSGPASLPANSVSTMKKDPPPPPPPRPYRTHTRSSSLDLNRLGKNGSNAPPVVPPRVSPGTISPKKQRSDAVGFADFAQFPPENSVDQPRTHGAFHVYRKPDAVERVTPPAEVPVLPSEASVEMRQEYNIVLHHLCADLQQDLVKVKEEHLTLLSQLQQLKMQHHQPPL